MNEPNGSAKGNGPASSGEAASISASRRSDPSDAPEGTPESRERRGRAREPILLARLERGERRELRLELRAHRGDDGALWRTLDARIWLRAASGDWHPTGAGVGIRASELGAVLDAVHEALRRFGRARRSRRRAQRRAQGRQGER